MMQFLNKLTYLSIGEAVKTMTGVKYLVGVKSVGLFWTGPRQIELDSLAELAGAWRAETHFNWK